MRLRRGGGGEHRNGAARDADAVSRHDELEHAGAVGQRLRELLQVQLDVNLAPIPSPIRGMSSGLRQGEKRSVI